MINEISSRVFYLCGVAVAMNLIGAYPAYPLNNTSMSAANSNSHEDANPPLQRQQYGEHINCFTWHDSSALDGGQQDVDGYCNLEGITPKLEFNEPPPDLSSNKHLKTSVISQESQEGQEDLSIPLLTVPASQAQQKQYKEKTVDSNNTVKLPGSLDGLQYKSLNSSLDEKSFSSIPIQWMMGIVVTLSLGLTAFLEQR